MKKYLSLIPLFFASMWANAASFLDTDTQSAITTGMSDLKDTFLQIMGIAIPVMIAVAGLWMGIRLVKRAMKSIF